MKLFFRMGNIKSEYIKQITTNFEKTCLLHTLHSGPENKKKSRPKKIVKSNKWISQKNYFFYLNPFFCNFKNGQKSNFELRKRLKLPKNAISRKNICSFIWVHEFFLLDFFKVSGPLWTRRPHHLGFLQYDGKIAKI